MSSPSLTARTSHVGERILEKLAETGRPLQLCDIVRAVGCNRSHCSNLLKQFIEHGMVARIEEFGKIFFCLTSHDACSPSQPVCSPSLESDACSPSLEPPVNMLTVNNVNLTNLTNKKDFEILGEAQASVAPVSPVPAVLPVANDETLFPITPAKEGEVRGLIFRTDTPTDSLYAMIDNMEGKMAPDPDALETIKCLSDVGKPKEIKMIPASEAFEKYVRKMWELLVRAHQKNIPGALKTCDFILHRAAYLFVVEPWADVGPTVWWRCPEDLIGAAAERNRKTSIYKTLVGMLKEVYLDLGYGWSEETLFNSITWEADRKRYGDDVWVGIFPSYRHETGSGKEYGKLLNRKTPTAVRAARLAHEARQIFKTQEAELDRQIRLDVMHRSDDVGERILAGVGDKIGEQRFDLWFGQDTQCVVDDAKQEVQFWVRNQFAINSIRRHCMPEIRQTVLEYAPECKQEDGTPRVIFAVQNRAPPPVSAERPKALLATV